jgi:hypothetical protein
MSRPHDLPRLTYGAVLWREVVAHHSVTSVSSVRLNGGDGVQIETMRWTPETGQVAKRESFLGAAGRPKVRHGQYSEEAQR